MEFEGVDGRIEWEARRVAAAFEVEIWQSDSEELTEVDFFGESSTGVSLSVQWVLSVGESSVHWTRVALDNEQGAWCDMFFDPDISRWYLDPSQEAPLELMARGLYRLGLEDESVWSKLPALSAHEKMELRLSLPHEFWPQKWRGDEVT